jgi:NAD(P)H-hydrate epimerase
MQSIEKKADESGISYQKMMENAGQGTAEWVFHHFPKVPIVLALIGSGNNGGDTLVALAILSKLGFRTMGFLAKAREEDALSKGYIKAGGSMVDISDGEKIKYLDSALQPGVIVLDGILGTGLKLPLRGQLVDVMGRVYNLIENRSGVSVVAVDCPSGIDCDTGEASEVTLTADHTLTMAAVKQGLLKHPAREKSGDLHIIDIGIEDISSYLSIQMPEMITKEMVRESLPKRPSEGHKGTFGTCLVIAGTPNYTGAAFLAGKAAYRGGCGLVHLATLKLVHKSLSGKLVEAVWTILPDVDEFYDHSGVGLLEETIPQADSLVIGPGWGLSERNEEFLEKLLRIIPDDIPTILDADGLKLISKIPQWWQLVPKQTILTPHPGEMAILGDLEINEIQSKRWAVAKEYAKRWGLTLVLKGAETVIADKDGRLWINPVSESALATAGSGDVLSGLIGGLLAQGLSTQNAAVVSTFIHSQAGILAKQKFGTGVSVTAVDILESLSDSFSMILRK